MKEILPTITKDGAGLLQELEKLRLEFLDLYTRHKYMVDQESHILTALYLEKLGKLQLDLLEKQTEAARLNMKMKLIQAAINSDEQPNLEVIEQELSARLQKYYEQIRIQAAALDEAKKILSNLLHPEEAKKLKEIFRVLCKRLHPDLNPNQTEEEKDLFIKVKAAYDLNRLSDLQNILLYLNDGDKEKLENLKYDEIADRISQIEKNIMALDDKITKLNQTFPFSFRILIYDEEYISQKRDEIQVQIKATKEKIEKYANIIKIMCDA